MRVHLLAAVLAPALSPPLLADTLTVGPAGDHPDIASAVAAAQAGDTILVAAGNYGAFVVDKPLHVVSTGGAAVFAFGANAVVVGALPADGEVVLSGLRIDAQATLAPHQAAIVLGTGPGRVTLHDVEVTGLTKGIAVHAQGCALLALLDCRIEDAGLDGSGTQRGAVEVVDCELVVANSTIVGDFSPNGFAESGDHALVVTGGRASIWSSELRGGDGLSGKGLFSVPNGGDGLRATDAFIRNFGGEGSELTGGDGASPGPFGQPGVGGAGLRLLGASVAHLAAGVPITAGSDASGATTTLAITVGPTAHVVSFPGPFPTLAVTAPTTQLGGTVTLEFAGTPGAPSYPYLAFHSGPPLDLPGVVGTSYLDLVAFAPLPPVVLDPLGEATLDLAVPQLTVLVGRALWFQTVEVAVGVLRISNPTVAVVTH